MAGAKILTDAELGEIRERDRLATRGAWEWRNNFNTLARQGSLPFCTPILMNHAIGTPTAGDAAFIAHARADVPALLATVKAKDAEVAERDHLLWVVSQDSEAYRRGVEDGWSQAAALWHRLAGVTTHEAIDEAIAQALGKRDLPPPLPPDATRAENERLRAALAKTLRVIEAYPGMTPVEELVAIERVARKALGEG